MRALAGIGRVQEEVADLRLPVGEGAAALATLQFISLLEDPRMAMAAGLLRTAWPTMDSETVMRLSFDPTAASRAVAQSPFATMRLSVPFNAGFYATHLELAGRGGAQFAWHVAILLRRQGDRMVNACRGVTSIELFYAGLGNALLHYRAARHMHSFFVDLSGSLERAEEHLPGITAQTVICEERRAVILGGLWHATGLSQHHLDPSSFPSLGAWMYELGASPMDRALASAHDLTLRLVIPTFLRDLGLGSANRMAGRANAACVLLSRALAALDHDGARNSIVPAEPDYRMLVRSELSAAHELLGEGAAAASHPSARGTCGG